MMRFTVDAKVFSDAMSKVSKVLRKNPIPILEEIAVRVENGRCTLTATDLETWLVAEIPTLGDDMSFVFSRTKDVMKACSHFEGELAITLVIKDEKDGTLEVRCGQRAAEFSVSSHEDYQVLKRILETPMLFCVYPFGPHLKECCHAFPSETYALGWADSIREQKFVSKMVAECPTDTKFFLTGKHAMDLKTENLYLEGIPINRCLKMMEAKQTIILINTFSHIYYPTAYLTLSLLGNVVVTHEDYFEALDKCECYRIRAYPEMPNAIGFYIDANEKCITTIAEFFQIEDNNE